MKHNYIYIYKYVQKPNTTLLLTDRYFSKNGRMYELDILNVQYDLLVSIQDTGFKLFLFIRLR